VEEQFFNSVGSIFFDGVFNVGVKRIMFDQEKKIISPLTGDEYKRIKRIRAKQIMMIIGLVALGLAIYFHKLWDIVFFVLLIEVLLFFYCFFSTCPRCKKNFFSTPFSSNMFSTRCLNCGISLYN